MSVPPVPDGAAVEVFYDGECPLCVREINMLRRRDRAGHIAFTNIAAPAFEASRYGKTHAELMGSIHGRDPDGTWLTGVEVFRQLYAAVGFARLVRLSRVTGVRQVLDQAYGVFSRNRLTITGRTACEADACAVPAA